MFLRDADARMRVDGLSGSGIHSKFNSKTGCSKLHHKFNFYLSASLLLFASTYLYYRRVSKEYQRADCVLRLFLELITENGSLLVRLGEGED